MHMDVCPVGLSRSRCRRWPRMLLLWLGLFAGLASLRAEEKILYPRAPVPADAPAPLRAAGTNTTLLGFALLAAATGGWLLWRQRQSAQTVAGKDGRKLAIAETRSLGNRQYLVVADYDGKKFLLGVCPGRIDLLSPLDGSPPPSRTP